MTQGQRVARALLRHLPGRSAAAFAWAVACACACALPAALSQAADSASDLFNTHFCFACHSLTRTEVKKLGPYMADVAAKYGSQAGAQDYLVKKILGGSQGVWGDPKVSVMPPNNVTPEEAAALVPWLLQQK